MIKEVVLPIFILLTSTSYGQDITGHWLGKSYWPGVKGDTATIYLDIQNDSKPNHFTGNSITVSEEFYGKTKFHGVYDPKQKLYTLTEDEVIESNSPIKSNVIFDKFRLILKQRATVSLAGTIECNPANGAINKASWGCDSKRKLILFHTTKPEPEQIKRSANNTIHKFIFNKDKMDTIWRKKDKLSWSDFKAIPDEKSPYAAVIYWDIDDTIDSITVGNDTVYFKYQTSAVISDSSWVKPSSLNEYALQHENGHFSIAKICAREMLDSIQKSFFLYSDFPKKYIRIRNEILNKFRSMDKQYDNETSHSLNRLNQERWNEFLRTRLY